MTARVIAAAFFALLLAGCGGSSHHTVKVYFVQGEQFAPVDRQLDQGEDAATGALLQLFSGPTEAERAEGIDTTIPAGTTLKSVTVSGKTATVDIAQTQTTATAFDISVRPARASQIVYTLTAIRPIQDVVINVNGKQRASFVGTTLAGEGALTTSDFSAPTTIPTEPAGVPAGPAPADPAAVQKRLVALKYLPAGAVTGKWDYETSQAVMAFQGWEGLDRDGTVGPQTLAALEHASAPTPASTGSGHRVEVYRAKGVTLLVDGSKLVLALHSSSGTAGYETPAGTYSVYRQEENSWSVPYEVWLPWASYFNGGIALHESDSVPAHPASHGCVRLPSPMAKIAYDFAPVGTPVIVS